VPLSYYAITLGVTILRPLGSPSNHRYPLSGIITMTKTYRGWATSFEGPFSLSELSRLSVLYFWWLTKILKSRKTDAKVRCNFPSSTSKCLNNSNVGMLILSYFPFLSIRITLTCRLWLRLSSVITDTVSKKSLSMNSVLDVFSMFTANKTDLIYKDSKVKMIKSINKAECCLILMKSLESGKKRHQIPQNVVSVF